MQVTRHILHLPRLMYDKLEVTDGSNGDSYIVAIDSIYTYSFIHCSAHYADDCGVYVLVYYYYYYSRIIPFHGPSFVLLKYRICNYRT